MRRAVTNLIRFCAAGLIILGGMEIGLELMRDHVKKAGISVGPCVLGTILILAGIMLFALSAKLARQLTDDVDE